MESLTQSDLNKLSGREIKNLISRGILGVMKNQDIPTTKEETPEYQQYKHLAGKPIHISEAARQYEIPQQTVSRWVQQGIISIIGKEMNRILIDRADMAYCAYIKKNNPGQGRRLFNKNGTPYVNKH